MHCVSQPFPFKNTHVQLHGPPPCRRVVPAAGGSCEHTVGRASNPEAGGGAPRTKSEMGKHAQLWPPRLRSEPKLVPC